MRLPDEEQQALRETCREVLGEHSTSATVRRIAESVTGHDDQLWKLTAELGWTALAVPEDAGGLGGSACDVAVVAEEFGRVVQPSLLPQTMAVAWVAARHAASPALLGGIASGEVIASWALGEPGGSEAVSLDSALRLDGRRDYVPDGQCATHVVVRAGERLVAVPLGVAGVSVTPMSTMDITRRYSRVTFAGVQAEPDWLVGGADAVTDLFGIGVVAQCAEGSGVAARLLDMTVTYAGQRAQFGRPIGSFQAIKHRIADMLIEVEGCRVATRQAAEALDAGTGVAEAVSIAKSWVGRAASYVASHALQIHGGLGFSWEHDLHLYLRRAKVNELLLGTPNWHDERLAAGIVGDLR
jgi:alkylation response protein AidB-like acyl-CoA dehydrogenase